MGKWLGLLLLAIWGVSAFAQDGATVSTVPSVASVEPIVAAAAKQPRKYAVLSLVGDVFRRGNMVYVPATPFFDRAALLAVNNLL